LDFQVTKSTVELEINSIQTVSSQAEYFSSVLIHQYIFFNFASLMAVSDLFSKGSTQSIQNIILKYLDQATAKKGLEIEARIGRIMNKITMKRMDFDTFHPIVFQRLPNEYEFEGEIAKEDFTKIKQLLFGESVTDKYKMVETVDKISISNTVRKIQSDQGIFYQKKLKLSKIDIHLPEYAYDVRISISQESDVEQKDFVQKPNLIQRSRERESYLFNEYSFDFTKVVNPRTAGQDRKYEIEVEVKDLEYQRIEFVVMALNLPVLKKRPN